MTPLFIHILSKPLNKKKKTDKLLILSLTDKSGSISLDNLKMACEEAGIKFTQKELEEMIEEADINGDGRVDQSEFIRIMLQTNLF